ncbi:SpoIIE family protein phosphatase [Streptomyces sp. NPDC059861]|uniref:ATP-binding SpoIIE family protein phosphatase n=1 Tax=Streptomyces sp. NPDC059861 TaxID=3346974 RepID=UPI0036503D3F
MLAQEDEEGLVAVSTSRATDRRSFTQKLREDAEIVIDQQGAVVGWSTAAHALLGFTASEMRGRSVGSLIASEQSIPIDGGSAERGLAAPVVLRCRDKHTEACRVWIRPAEHPPDRWIVIVSPVPEGAESQVVGEAVLDTLFKQSPTSLCVYGTDLRLSRFNPAAKGMQGIFGDKSIGLMPHELWPDSNSAEFELRMREVLKSGVPHVGFEKRGRPPDDPEHDHVFANSVFRLEDPTGRVIGLATTAVEITEQRIAEERITLLADASAVIGTSLDVVETGQQLADVAVPRFADAATVDVFTPVISGEEPDPDRADLRRVGLRYAGDTDSSGGTANPLKPRFPYSASTGEPVADEPYRVDTLLPSDDGEPLYRGTCGKQPAHSLVVPMRARGAVAGLVTFYRLGQGSPFSDFDVLTARDLASRAALSIDNARRYTQEHSAARALQHQLLPHHFAEQTAVETAHYFAPATSGANWFDVIPVSGARVVLAVATSNETGLSGAAALGRLGTAVHALTDLDLNPEEVLSRLDTLIARIAGKLSSGSAPQPHDTGFEITCLYAVYDPASGRLSLASAGHPPPVVAEPDARAKVLTIPMDAPLGAPERHSTTTEFDLPAGSTLALYTPTHPSDGPRTDQGPDLLTRAMASTADVPLEELRDQILAALPDAVSSPRGTVLLLARTHRLDEDHMSTWDLPSDPAVVATARSLVQRQLTVWGLQATAFVTELVVSELVTNAIRHAEGPVHLRVIRDHHVLICEVSDRSTTAPHLRYARSGDEGGRGLFLIAELTQRWGTRFSDSGKTIWTEQDVEHELDH